MGPPRLMALWIVMKHEHNNGTLSEILSSYADPAGAETATPDDVWRWYESTTCDAPSINRWPVPH